MYLLTWHGTLLRVENASQRLIQAPLLPQRPSARDFAIPAAALAAGEAVELTASNGVVLHPGPAAETRHLTIRAVYASARPGQTEILADQTEPSEHATFLVLSPETLAGLRRLLAGTWRIGDQSFGAAQIALEPGFQLRLGDRRLKLATTTLLYLGGGELFIDHPDEKLTLAQPQDPARAPQPAGADDLFLRPATAATAPKAAADAEDFTALRQARLTLPYAPELCAPPLTTTLAERDWLYTAAVEGNAPRTGLHAFACVALHQRESYVLLAPPAEGMIFTADGTSPQAARLLAMRGAAHDFLSTEGDAVFITRAALDTAPYLPGPVAVPYASRPGIAASWLIDLLPRLFVLAPLLPADTTLLLPDDASAEAATLLAAFGFAGLATQRVETPLCLADDVFTLADQAPADMPAEVLRGLRARAEAALPALNRPRRRLYLRGGHAQVVENAGPVEAHARNQKFEVTSLAGLSAAEKLELFRAADFVIAPHGEDLAWLLLCAPGTKVISFVAEHAYDPVYDQISTKLGLVHLVLPCPTLEGKGDTRLVVSPHRFRAAIWLQDLRQ